MTQKSKSRNADFILIAREGDTKTLGLKAVKLKNLKNPRGEAPSTLEPKARPLLLDEIPL